MTFDLKQVSMSLQTRVQCHCILLQRGWHTVKLELYNLQLISLTNSSANGVCDRTRKSQRHQVDYKKVMVIIIRPETYSIVDNLLTINRTK